MIFLSFKNRKTCNRNPGIQSFLLCTFFSKFILQNADVLCKLCQITKSSVQFDNIFFSLGPSNFTLNHLRARILGHLFRKKFFYHRIWFGMYFFVCLLHKLLILQERSISWLHLDEIWIQSRFHADRFRWMFEYHNTFFGMIEKFASALGMHSKAASTFLLQPKKDWINLAVLFPCLG